LGRKAKVVHVGFDDPPALAREAGTEEEALACYRRVRDEIGQRLRPFYEDEIRPMRAREAGPGPR